MFVFTESHTTCIPFRYGCDALQGDCSVTEDVPFEDWMVGYPRSTPSQCVLRSPSSFLQLPESIGGAAEPNRLWLDNLYITSGASAQGPAPPAATPTLVTVSEGSELWITHVALIGSSRDANSTSSGTRQPALVSRGVHALAGSSVLARSVHPVSVLWHLALHFESKIECMLASFCAEAVP